MTLLFKAVHCIGGNNCSEFKQAMSKMDSVCLMSILRLYPGLKMTFEHTTVRKNLFLTACFSWDAKPSFCEMEQKLILVKPLFMGTRTWTSYVIILKYSGFMEHYMMLLEKRGRKKAKAQAPATRFDGGRPTKIVLVKSIAHISNAKCWTLGLL